MKPLLTVLRVFWRAERSRFLLGVAMAVVTIAAGVGLLGLSGWFITASAVAGVAGIGLTFDFFRPSAGIRFLALARTASRYGERLTTHDATLSFLARVRRRLFDYFASGDFVRLGRLKSGEVLARITADVDSLDAVYLRLFVPLASAVVMIVATAAAIALLSPLLAVLAGALLLAGLCVAVVIGVRLGAHPGRKMALAREALRIRLIDLTKGLVELHFAAMIPAHREKVLKADAAESAAGYRVNRVETIIAQILFGTGQIALLVVLAVGAGLVAKGILSAAQLALVLLVVLALQEATGATSRGLATVGRTLLAARRLAAGLAPGEASVEPRTMSRTETARPSPAVVAGSGQPRKNRSIICIENITYSWNPNVAPCVDGFSLDLEACDKVALVGPSGAGKSTVLAIIAGLVAPTGGQVSYHSCGGRRDVALLPQKSAIFSASIAENLRLASPMADEDDIWRALEIAQIDKEIRALPDGLETLLGERGAGLSGGQLRRLAVARLVLTKPKVFLLDEPTEGLSETQGQELLAALFDSHPDAAFLIATHRAGEAAMANRRVSMVRDPVETSGGSIFTEAYSLNKR